MPAPRTATGRARAARLERPMLDERDGHGVAFRIFRTKRQTSRMAGM